MSATLLSIDWDFFVYTGEHESGKIVTPKFPQGISPMYLYDWGHSETWSAPMSDVLWVSRYAGLLRAGLDPIETVKVMPPGVRDFSAFVEARKDFDALSVADSHSLGAQEIVNLSSENDWERIDVVSFDAHHDLGYKPEDIMDVRNGNVQCASWLLYGLERGMVENATIVFPDWKSYDDWPPPDYAMRFVDEGRVKVTTWADYAEANDDRYDAAFLCRSSAWTPPWLDGEFVKLMLNLSREGKWRCWDCRRDVQRTSAFDGHVARVFDIVQAEQHAEASEEFMRRHQEET